MHTPLCDQLDIEFPLVPSRSRSPRAWSLEHRAHALVRSA